MSEFTPSNLQLAAAGQPGMTISRLFSEYGVPYGEGGRLIEGMDEAHALAARGRLATSEDPRDDARWHTYGMARSG